MSVVLATALLVSASATAGLCYWHMQSVRQLQMAQEHVARINRNKALVQSLAGEALEYSKRNPALTPVLQKFGVRLRAETNAPAGGGQP